MFNLLMLSDEEFHEILRQFAMGEIKEVPAGFKDHALWILWRDRDARIEADLKNKKRLILPAVRYVAWCKAGLIPDTHYNATVRDEYGLSDTDLVKKWVKLNQTPETPDKPTDIPLDVLADMSLAGAIYKNLYVDGAA